MYLISNWQVVLLLSSCTAAVPVNGVMRGEIWTLLEEPFGASYTVVNSLKVM